jgi:hypothetical protein
MLDSGFWMLEVLISDCPPRRVNFFRKADCPARFWNLKIEVSLDIGAWDLELVGEGIGPPALIAAVAS